MIAATQRWKKDRPCPICQGYPQMPQGQGTRCYGYLSTDGKYAHCTREEYANGKQKHPNSDTYAHLLDEPRSNGGPPPNQTSAPKQTDEVYSYRDENGVELFETVRYIPKDFRQRRMGPNGRYIWNLQGVRIVLYRLPELLKTTIDQPLFFLEGEKDVDAVWGLGFPATCNPMGANAWRRLDPSMIQHFKGRTVVLVPDNDDKGRELMRQVGASLHGTAASVRWLELEVPPNGDISDWIETEAERLISSGITDKEQVKQETAEALDELAQKAEPFDPARAQETTSNSAAQSEPSEHGPLSLSPNVPTKSADEFVCRKRPTLMHFNGDWLDFQGAAYVDLEDATIRSELYGFLQGATTMLSKPFNPTRPVVTNVVDALQARAHRRSDQFAPPCWLEGTGPEPLQIIVCQNGLLHLPTDTLSPLSPRFFTRNALAFEFDPDAPEPERWLKFLDQVWEGRNEEIETLQEIFGYLLVPDTSLQKIFLLVGPRRSGKGTIAKVLTHLVGQRNVCAPMPNTLSGNFGLQPLIGKQVAFISDMRLGQKTDYAAIAENLLRISGEDTVSVDRKYKSVWTGQLAVRFFIMTNVLPRFVDVSGAVASRFVPLIMHRSFLGRENPKLLQELLPELPGILNWSIVGWRRLHERHYFSLPAESAEAVQQLGDLASPHAVFIRDRCELDPNWEEPKKSVYGAWKIWCEEHGHHPGAMETFSAGLLAASGGKVETCKPREEGRRVPSYRGIRLRSDDTSRTTDPPF